MVTIAVLVTIRIDDARSLKEKRAVVRSLVERLRHRKRLTAAEVGMQDRVQWAQVGFAVVSGSAAEAASVIEDAQRFVEAELIGRAEVIDVASDEMVIE
jgi:uncharacterized protein